MNEEERIRKLEYEGTVTQLLKKIVDLVNQTDSCRFHFKLEIE